MKISVRLVFTYIRDNMNNEFLIEEKGFDKRAIKHYEGLFCQGNGYVHVRASHEDSIYGVRQDDEYDRKPANVTLEKPRETLSKYGTFIPGVTGVHPYLKDEIINLPYPFMTEVFLNGDKVDITGNNIENYNRSLDLYSGTLTRTIEVVDKAYRVRICHERVLSMDCKHLALEKTTISLLEGKCHLGLVTGVDARVRTNGFNHLVKIETGKEADRTYLKALTNGGNTVDYRLRTAAKEMDLIPGADDSRCYYTGEKNLGGSCKEISLEKVVAITTDRDFDKFEDNTGLGYEDLKKNSDKVWAKIWDDCDIVIKGDDKTQQALRMAIYHLIRNATDDDRVAICAKGHSGEGYFGHYFWDTEINMLPFYLYEMPDKAKNLVKFRYNTLDGAIKNAKLYGYDGARYAWESSVSGEEECANWQYADNEIHVTADIVYAMINYVRMTSDQEFYKECVIPVMIETAKYWLQRMDKRKDGSLELLGVMGPDEYLPFTRNNAYTNKLVRFSLEETAKAIEKYNVPVERDFLLSVKYAAENLKGYAPLSDNERVIKQCDEFEEYADIDFGQIWTDRSKCFGNHISQEKNYRSKALKQADVLEMMMLFPHEFSTETLKANFDYYLPITTHDSSLSAYVHGLLAARLGRTEIAERFLKIVDDIDMDSNRRGAEEGVHIANFGGLWQMVVFGFAGLSYSMWDDDISIKPALPAGWKSLEFKTLYKGNKYKVTIGKDTKEIVKLS
ncbi:MAG: glycoside hydrolase family 65 protein [Pseudobutyrivibrio sp.]|nr:glycoside hydrolase family 65 protein [Pseudobutyrivibrio sp.]